MEMMMITEAQLDRALYVFNDVNTDAPRKSVREALREAIEAAQPSMKQDGAEITADVGILAFENRDYLRLVVEPRGEPLRRLRISRGMAIEMSDQLKALLRKSGNERRKFGGVNTRPEPEQ